MKTIPNLYDYKVELAQIFQQSKEVEVLLEKIRLLFTKILFNFSYMKLPNFQIILTGSLKFSVWYQEPNAITETLNIHQEKCDLYLWRCVDQKWYLDDLYSDVNEVAEQILKSIPAFHSTPENPKEVKTLLENGLMNFEPEIFPKFSETIPDDLNEVLTWDDRFVLVGTSVENLKIYTYKEWNELIERENFYKYV
ncbi:MULTISPECIES: hypothetical protein [Acinetobacter]|uniref:Uncharacterized protein n=1 Tax=Acinetobacter piscicola TaxID=2006115 RepID=A0A4Q4H306_9GAMM|nr:MULTISPECIES: hypothetical protein [Acinetobacter]QOW45681.1 hypothetical protein G0028_07125 [Acinetobacter piscicola]RYL28324.1 hypothetical protein EWP19_02995 [Acinetobacter piscicola]